MTDRNPTDEALAEATSKYALRPDEADELFAAAWAARGETPNIVDLQSRRRAILPTWFAAAAAIVLAAPIIWYSQRELSPEGTGIKSAAGTPNVELTPIVGTVVDGEPSAGRVLPPGGELAPGERVLLRYRVDRPAHLTLWVQPRDGAVEVLWTGDVQAGDGEVGAGGSAHALNPEGYGPFTLAVGASVRGQVEEPPAELTAQAIRTVCVDYGVDVVDLVGPRVAP